MPCGTVSVKSHTSLLSLLCGSGVLLLSRSAQQFAPEMLFVAVKYILFLCLFFKCNLFEKLQYDRVSKHMINKMCFASFSMICNNVG